MSCAPCRSGSAATTCSSRRPTASCPSASRTSSSTSACAAIASCSPIRSAATTFQRDRQRLATLVEHGTLLQVTAVSLSSTERRSRSRRLALELVRHGLAHVIASDSHGGHIPRAGLKAGVEAAARIAPQRAEWMVTDAPAAILAGEPLPPAPSDGGGGRRLARLRPG